MNEPLLNKLKRKLKFYANRIFGKKYGCCDKWFVSCKKCLKIKCLVKYEKERLEKIYAEIKVKK